MHKLANFLNMCCISMMEDAPKPARPPKQHSTSASGKKKPRSKPLQNKKRKLQKFKGTALPKGKKPKKY